MLLLLRRAANRHRRCSAEPQRAKTVRYARRWDHRGSSIWPGLRGHGPKMAFAALSWSLVCACPEGREVPNSRQICCPIAYNCPPLPALSTGPPSLKPTSAGVRPLARRLRGDPGLRPQRVCGVSPTWADCWADTVAKAGRGLHDAQCSFAYSQWYPSPQQRGPPQLGSAQISYAAAHDGVGAGVDGCVGMGPTAASVASSPGRHEAQCSFTYSQWY